MHALSFSFVDVLVVLTIIVSASLAIWRGFIRETLSIFAWAAAAFATIYFGPSVAHLVKDRFSSPWLGSLIAYAGVFLLVLIPLSFVSYRFSEGVKHSPIGAIDRSLGAAFGIVRGFAIVGLAYMLFSVVVPVPTQPAWVSQARLLPVIQESSSIILSLLPGRERGHPASDTAVASAPDAPVPKPRPATTATHHAAKAYGADERHALDRLIQATGSGGNDKQ